MLPTTRDKKLFLLTGASLVLMAIIAGLGYGYAFGSFYIPESGEETYQRLHRSPGLLYSTIACFIVIVLLDVIVSVDFLAIFKKMQEFLAMLVFSLRLIYSAMLGAAISYLLSAASHFQQGSNYSAELLRDIVIFLSSWNLALIVFGLHLVLLGWLICRSAMIPIFIGYITCIAGVCYLVKSGLDSFIPNLSYGTIIELVLGLSMAMGELVLAAWMIWQAVRKR